VRRTLQLLWEASLHRRGIGGNLLYFLLLSLTPIYRLGLFVSQARRRARPSFARRIPVLIVGNLTTGGTGKTPMAMDLAALLRGAGFKPAVVSRGYGRKRKRDPDVVCDWETIILCPDEAGDEPAMMARQCQGHGISLVVGRDRVAAAELAVEKLQATALVLDDGYQQRMRFPGAWKLAMVNAAEPFGNDALLPAGNLREPASALGGADAVVLSHSNEVDEVKLGAIRERVRALAPGAVHVSVGYQLDWLDRGVDGTLPAEAIKGKKVMAISAIGYPEGFERMLEKVSGVPVMAWRAPDHHEWTSAEYRDAVQAGLRAGCEFFVTTAKDRMKIDRLGIPAVGGGVPSHALHAALVSMVDLGGKKELESVISGYLAGLGS